MTQPRPAFIPPSRRYLALATLVALALTAGCANVPELDERMEDWVRDADYPQLHPLEGLQSGVPLPADQAQDLERQMAARRARLQARARALNTPIVDDAAQTRMQAGVTEPVADQLGNDQTNDSQ